MLELVLPPAPFPIIQAQFTQVFILLIIGQVIAALNSGSVPLDEKVDTQCYNYSLPYDFKATPEVAIAIHDFESEHSNTYFFFIKTLHT